MNKKPAEIDPAKENVSQNSEKKQEKPSSENGRYYDVFQEVMENEEFISFLFQNKRQINNYNTYLHSEIKKRGFSPREVQSICCENIDTEKILKKESSIKFPHNRLFLIRFAYLLRFSIDETNTLLMEYGNFPALYSKDVNDCIHMFLLNQACPAEKKIGAETAKADPAETGSEGDKTEEDTNETFRRPRPVEDFNYYYQIVIKNCPFLNRMPSLKEDRGKNIRTTGTKDFTNYLKEHLSSIDALIRFINQNEAEFRYAMLGVINQIDRLVEQTTKQIKKEQKKYKIVSNYAASMLQDPTINEKTKTLLAMFPPRTENEIHRFSSNKAHSLFADNEKFRKLHSTTRASTFEQRDHPVRDYIIALGIHLNMNEDQLNQLLELNHFAPLQMNDTLEAAIIFILEDIENRAPSFFVEKKIAIPANAKSENDQTQPAVPADEKPKDDLAELAGMIVKKENPAEILKKLGAFANNDMDLYHDLACFGLSYVVKTYLDDYEKMILEKGRVSNVKQIPGLKGTNFSLAKMKRLLWMKDE